jgi:hypothetical protein
VPRDLFPALPGLQLCAQGRQLVLEQSDRIAALGADRFEACDRMSTGQDRAVAHRQIDLYRWSGVPSFFSRGLRGVISARYRSTVSWPIPSPTVAWAAPQAPGVSRRVGRE